jgi:hypothetical protein
MITQQEKIGLQKFYDVNIKYVKEALECLKKDLDIANVKRLVAKNRIEEHRYDTEILIINDKVSRELGKLDILNSLRFCAI